ncbi:restriction methylase [Escherichia coli]|nr:restriction methylase [Escherichia coli]
MSNSSDSDQTVQAVRLRSRSLEYDNFPEISEANILSTFEQLHQNKDEVFERGVINVFKGLSWDYKTNSPCKFGSKIIVNNLVRWDQWG